jgi:hypothetical protein
MTGRSTINNPKKIIFFLPLPPFRFMDDQNIKGPAENSNPLGAFVMSPSGKSIP